MVLFPEQERVQLHPAYILHQRPYRNTSLLLDVLTAEHGRISLIAKGAKRAKSPFRGCLQPFQPLSISWLRKTELGTLIHAEIVGSGSVLAGEAMYAGLYLNELLTRVLIKNDASLEIYQPYVQALNQLTEKNIATVLRVFEYQLLQSLGFEIQLSIDADHRPILSELSYKYIPEHGFIRSNEKHVFLFSGHHLLAFNDENFDLPGVLKTAQRLMQIGLRQLLGSEPLKSRELYKAFLNIAK